MPRFNDATTLEHCLLELVLNSLKAQATAIAVRIHHRNHTIQVVDNGSGISKCALKYIGIYSMEKEDSLPRNLEKNNILKEGSLIKIRGFSSSLIIMSRSQFNTETYRKCFDNGRVSEVQRIEDRPSSGTTVTVYASSKLCNWGEEINCSAVKFVIVYLSLVNTQVSFSVRDDMNGTILLRVGKFQKRKRLFRVIFERPISPGQVQRIKPQILDKIKISGFWGAECALSRKIQQVLVNFRPVHYPLLEKFMLRIVTKICYANTENSNFYLEKIFFLVYIECPDSEYNISVKNTERPEIHFPQNDEILNSIKICITKTEAEKLKPRTTFGCKSTIPLITCFPTGRILGAKQKKSFFTKVSRHKFQRSTAVAETKSKIESPHETKNPTKLRSNDFNVMNSAIARRTPQDINIDDLAPIKTHEYNGPQDSRGSQGLIKESELNKNKTELLTQSASRDIKISSKNVEQEKRRISILSETCVERHQHDVSESLPISRTRSQVVSINTKQNDFENYLPRLSQKLVQITNDIGEIPIVSDSWLPEYVEEVKVNFKSQENVRKTQECINESLLKSGCKIAGKTFSSVKEYQYNNHGVLWISQISNEKSLTRLEQIYDVGCSQWSNWTYEPATGNYVEENRCETARPVLYQRFRFLPLNLHALLPFLNEKLIKDLSKEVEMPINLNLNHRPQDFEVRPCTRRSLEFRLKIESLKSMKILNQVNKEFIVALAQQDDKKLVVVVDQHAMHERIRYENLLRAYKRDQKNQQFISITLHHPIIISDFSTSICNLLASNQDLLTRYGLSLAFRNETTLLIFAVPRCFLKKTFRTDNVEVEIAVRRLLQEVLDNLTTNGVKKFLPFTIHDAIASEACRGSIKFGDPLTLKQCENLVSCWTETDAPNRCAHGRPSIIPLLELSSHRRNHYKLVCQEKLNFASLRKFRRTTGKIQATTLRYHPYVTLAKNQEFKFQFDDEALR